MILSLLSLLVFAAPGDDPRPVFVDRTRETGIGFRHRAGSAEKDYIFEVNGSGVALFDADGDADLDVYFANGSRLEGQGEGASPGDGFYRNDGGWSFADRSHEAGLGDSGWSCAAVVADVENDGDIDLYVTNWGPNVLYLNHGDGSFALAAESGAEDAGMSTSASFGDFNRDGLVDLYVANYVELDIKTARKRGDPGCTYKGVPIFCGPGGLNPAQDRFYVNRGGGAFRDATREWGVLDAGPAYGLGTLALDVNRDGWLDLIVANDTQRNFCFLGREGKRFEEAALYLGLAYNDYGIAQAGMGVASGDTRGIGRDDIFITNFEDDTNTLHLAQSGGLYSEGTAAGGLAEASYAYLGWGTFFFDADNDGDLDIFVANGHVAPQADSLRASIGYKQKNHLYLNDGTGRYSLCDTQCGSGLDVMESSRGAACGDLDGDGDLDVVVNNIDAPPTLLENTTLPGNSWVEIRLRGTRSNRLGVGARVTMVCGARRLERVVQGGLSFASQCEPTARFGLGTNLQPDSVLVDWPSGRREKFTPPQPRTSTTLVEGEGQQP